MPVERIEYPSRRSQRMVGQTPYHTQTFYVDVDQFEDLRSGLRANVGSSASTSPATTASSLTSSPASVDDSLPSLSDDGSSHRHSHSRKKKPGHVTRPPNPFILYRSDLCNGRITSTVENDHRQISRIAGLCWKQLPENVKDIYRMRAEAAKKQHAELHPEYKYAPVYREKPASKRRSKKDPNPELERAADIADLIQKGIVGARLAAMAPRKKTSRITDTDSIRPPSAHVVTPSSNATLPSKSTLSSKRSIAPQRASRSLDESSSVKSNSAGPSPEPVVVPSAESVPHSFDNAISTTAYLPFPNTSQGFASVQVENAPTMFPNFTINEGVNAVHNPQVLLHGLDFTTVPPVALPETQTVPLFSDMMCPTGMSYDETLLSLFNSADSSSPSYSGTPYSYLPSPDSTCIDPLLLTLLTPTCGSLDIPSISSEGDNYSPSQTEFSNLSDSSPIGPMEDWKIFFEFEAFA